MAPPRFARNGGEAANDAKHWWRGLRMAVVPMPGGISSGGKASGRELVHGFTPTVQGGVALGAEANGPVLRCVNAGLGFATTATIIAKMIPTAAPFSVFAFVARRDTSVAIQSLVGNGYLGNNGWTFQLNYGAGEIGLTRWGIADNKSTTLGAVPNTGGQASAVGMALDGSNVRFFLNGAFQTVTSGSVNAPTSSGTGYQVGVNSIGNAPLVNTSVHVLYVWNRVLSDEEMLALWRDPWAPLRPDDVSPFVTVAAGSATVFPGAGQLLLTGYEPSTGTAEVRVTQAGVKVLVSLSSGGTADARITQAGAKVLAVPDPAARITQAGVKVLVAPTAAARVTQAGVKVLIATDVTARVTQAGVKVLVQRAPISVPLTGLLFPRGSVPPF